MDKLKLVFPIMEYEKQAKELVEEAKKYDKHDPNIFAGFSGLQEYEDYNKWIEKINRQLNEKTVDEGKVPASVYFSVRETDNKIVGIINIRYYLNEYLSKYGGHIGYSIRYTERQKGYGHEQLRLALEKCRELSIDKVLVTCRDNNVGSSKTIESCNGILENTMYNESLKVIYKRYWIDVK